MYLIFDTETIGLPKNFNISYTDFDNWSTARCVQLAWQLHDRFGNLISSGNDIIKPIGFEIPQASIKIHQITNEIANTKGIFIQDSLDKFKEALEKTTFLIGHNIQFDINVVSSEYCRIYGESPLLDLKTIDTMKSTTEYCQLRIGKEGVVSEVTPYGKFKDFFKFKINI